MNYTVALIGGTGIGQELRKRCSQTVHVPTRFGLFIGEGAPGRGILCVARHGERHQIPPHRINYLEMAEGLRRLGVRYAFSSAAVGALDSDIAPGTLLVCSDLLGFFLSGHTYFTTGVVHTDFSNPFDEGARRFLLESARRLGVAVEDGGVYVGMPGPRYETFAEVRALRALGGTVVGMTVGAEAVYIKEAGISYACLAVVTNWATGLGDVALAHTGVSAVMEKQAPVVTEILWQAGELARRDGVI